MKKYTGVFVFAFLSASWQGLVAGEPPDTARYFQDAMANGTWVNSPRMDAEQAAVQNPACMSRLVERVGEALEIPDGGRGGRIRYDGETIDGRFVTRGIYDRQKREYVEEFNNVFFTDVFVENLAVCANYIERLPNNYVFRTIDNVTVSFYGAEIRSAVGAVLDMNNSRDVNGKRSLFLCENNRAKKVAIDTGLVVGTAVITYFSLGTATVPALGSATALRLGISAATELGIRQMVYIIGLSATKYAVTKLSSAMVIMFWMGELSNVIFTPGLLNKLGENVAFSTGSRVAYSLFNSDFPFNERLRRAVENGEIEVRTDDPQVGLFTCFNTSNWPLNNCYTVCNNKNLSERKDDMNTYIFSPLNIGRVCVDPNTFVLRTINQGSNVPGDAVYVTDAQWRQIRNKINDQIKNRRIGGFGCFFGRNNLDIYVGRPTFDVTKINAANSLLFDGMRIH